jgi:CheY-like chemotaxis protein/HAMP domain-containing protein
MLASLRARLTLIVGIALSALLLILGVGTYIAQRQAHDLAYIQGRLLPKLQFGPKLEGQFEKLRQGLQDAAAAQDKAALDASYKAKQELFELIANSSAILKPAEAATLRWSIQEYYESGYDVARRLIAGETGETLVDDMTKMQARHNKAREAVRRASGFDQQELAQSFATVRDAAAQAARLRIAIGATALVLVLVLTFLVGRRVVRALDDLSHGLLRFSTGDLSSPIPVHSGDELGAIATQANQMAASLKTLGEQRDRNDWLREGLAGLSDELRGELDPATVGRRALVFLARRVGAPIAALYNTDNVGNLKLLSHYGLDVSATPDAAAGLRSLRTSFRPGEGLVGECAQGTEIVSVDKAPEGYFKLRSGLGEAPPHALVLVPLSRLGTAIGVLELGLPESASQELKEFLRSISEMLVSTLEVAASRQAQRELLERTRQQAEKLSAQEEELRMNNQELQAQQEELRRANEELESQREVLSEQNHELEAARARVQQKVEELDKVNSYKSQFLANMSHELRTPLNSMLLLSHLLGENDAGNLDPKQVEHCRTIHSAGQDLLGLINQVLDLAKIESGKQEVNLESVELQQFVMYARRVFEPLANERQITLAIEVAPGLPRAIVTDQQRLERILTNLLGNAIKFTERGEVKLSITRPAPGAELTRADLAPGSTVAFAVSDTGVGIPKEAQERIFAPFEQVDAHSNRRYSGTGLGLAIARESANLLGGELQLSSTPGKGSTFTCFLPELPSKGQPKAAPALPSREHAQVADDRAQVEPGKPHLLVIEDDPVFAERLVDIIHLRNFRAVVANRGEEGLKLALELKPAGIILDVKLPDVDGWTVMDHLRNDPATRNIPVHFVSGVDASERGLSLGAVGYLTKPATHHELAAAVRTLTPGTKTASRILVVEDDTREGQSILALLSQAHLEASHVKSAREAVEAIRTSEFGCVILDLGLPDMDGLELLAELRKDTGPNNPRIVVHTGRALTRKETQELEAYAQAVIVKDGRSTERLLEEMRLFVRHLEESLPKPVAPKTALVTRRGGNGDVSLAGIKVLLAEDDMRTVYALSALLRGKGADVLVADTGKEALDLLGRNPNVHAVLMDVMMPEMDGYDAMRAIRKDERFTRLPIIALTAKAMKGERERCIEAGASDYLTKPVDTDHLLFTVQSWAKKGEKYEH